MEPRTYRTQNYEKSLSAMRSLYLLLAVLALPAIICVTAINFAQKSPNQAILGGIFLIVFVGFLMSLPWLYSRGFRNLSFTVDDQGLTVRFLRTLFIPWAEVVSVEKVRPGAIVGMRLCGLGWTVTHGLFSTKLGRAWLWLAGEPEALFLR